MILKKIIHFFCGRSLEKQTAKTNALIREAEQKEKAAVERLKAQADNYQAQVRLYKKKRDTELKEFMGFMNSQLELADAYTHALGYFQDKMFICIDSWMEKDLLDQNIQLRTKKIYGKRKLLDFISALQKEMYRLTQYKERAEWSKLIEQRPILVSSAFIKSTTRNARKSQDSSNADIKRDLNRLKSHYKKLAVEIRELRIERDSLIASSEEINAEHKNHKSELNNQYRKCSNFFWDIKDRFSNHFGSVTTGNTLSDSWIFETEGLITLPKIFLILKNTAEIQREAKQDFYELKKKFHDVRSKIDASRQNGDFSTFNEDKIERDRLFHEKKKAQDIMNEIFEARKVIYKRGDELKEMLARFQALDPDESIRRFIELFNMEEKFDIYHVVGVRTREEQRKYSSRKREAAK